jgi:transcription elongation factor GreA
MVGTAAVSVGKVLDHFFLFDILKKTTEIFPWSSFYKLSSMSDQNQTQYLSQEKHEALKKELKELKEHTIPTIANRIDEARQMGDLSENAEYHQAREEMAWTQSRVKELGYILERAEIISDQGNQEKDGVVRLGSSLTIEVNGKEKTYTIVGAQEADPLEGKISNESPLGEALMGRETGENVEVTVPAGVQVYRIISVS